MSLYDKESLRVFQNSTLDLIDNAYSLAVNPPEAVLHYLKNMGTGHGARDFRTIRVSGCRGIGHTHLINRLAYDVDSMVGSKYSSLIVTTRQDMAKDYYLPFRRPEDYKSYPSMIEYSRLYYNTYNEIAHDWNNTGKAISVGAISALGFSTESWIRKQQETMRRLSPVFEDKFDIMCVDMASWIPQRDLDYVYECFSNHVRLFVLMQ